MNAAPAALDPQKVVAASGGLSWTRVRTPRLLARLAKVGFALSGVGGALAKVGFALSGVGGALRPLRGWRRASPSPGLAARSGVGGALLLLGQTPLGAVLAVVSAAAWPLFIVSYILSLTQTSFPAALEIHDDHLAIQGPAKRVVLVRAEIRSALVVDRRVFDHDVPTVEIELVNGDVLVARLAEPGLARATPRPMRGLGSEFTRAAIRASTAS